MEQVKIERSDGLLSKLAPLFLIAAAATVVAVIALIPAKEAKPAPQQAVPVNVTVEPVTALAELRDSFDLPGEVDVYRTVRVSAEVAGRIERLGYREGAACEAGKPLVVLNTDLLQAEYDRAAARAAYDKTQYERIKKLFDSGAATDRELDQAGSDMAASRAAMDAARAQRERAVIKAPMSGILDKLPVEAGEYVQAGRMVGEIVDVDKMKVVVYVPERDIPYIKPGAQAHIFTDLDGKRAPVTGEVTYVSELADKVTHVTRIEITVDNRDHALRSGQIVRAQLARGTLKNVIMVPLRTVIPLEKGHVVYVVDDGRAERREVTLGLIKGDRVGITAGLNPGERLIVKGHRFVGPGQPVHVVEP